ncbi:condensation domain-containing protein [Micromonospora lutea]|uniref:condensation domain-containing protein n=1 Tax=Micromonospora lutea TaxID=419825 RepID=UPI0019515DD7|nr:condensation domain-containing protein [Micromonospora lutea]
MADQRTVDAEATWGQRAIWSCIQFMGEHDPYFNAGRVLPVPQRCGLTDVADALGELLRRHETLRTVFEPAGSTLRQTVQGAGELPVAVEPLSNAGDASADGAAWARMYELAGLAFRMREWPVRIAVLTEDDRPRFVAMVFSHLAVDHTGADLVMADLAELLAGRRPPLPERQPIDQAEYERSAAGQATSAAALRHWVRVLRSIPASIFDYRTHETGEHRFRRMIMYSEAVTVAAAVAAARLRVTSSAVLLAAEALVLGRYTGHEVVPVQLICANRDAERDRLVGTVAGDGVVRVDLAQDSFARIVRRTFLAAVGAYRFGYYDPEAAWRMRAAEHLARGAVLGIGVYFNDVRDSVSSVRPTDPVDGQSLRRIAAATRIEESGGWGLMDARVFLTVAAAGSSTRLSMLCDTAYVPTDDIVALLRGIERVVIAAATDDLSAQLLSETIGVPPVARGPGWVRGPDGWVDLAGTRALWRDLLPDGTVGGVFLDEDPALIGSGLVGYLAGPPVGDVGDLHEAFVAALGERTDVRAPARYVRCAHGPDDPDDRQAWAKCPVLAEETGRRTEGSTGRLSVDPAVRRAAWVAAGAGC